MSEENALVVLQVTLAYLVPFAVAGLNVLMGGMLFDFGPMPTGMELACPP